MLAMILMIAGVPGGSAPPATFPDNVKIDLRIDCDATFTRTVAGRSEPIAKREYIFLFPSDSTASEGATIPFVQTDSGSRTFFLRATTERVDRESEGVFRIVLVTSYGTRIELSGTKPIDLDNNNIAFRSSYTDPDDPGKVEEHAACKGRSWSSFPIPRPPPPPAR